MNNRHAYYVLCILAAGVFVPPLAPILSHIQHIWQQGTAPNNGVNGLLLIVLPFLLAELALFGYPLYAIYANRIEARVVSTVISPLAMVVDLTILHVLHLRQALTISQIIVAFMSIMVVALIFFIFGEQAARNGNEQAK